MNSKKSGFTLIELMVVVLIIGILAMLCLQGPASASVMLSGTRVILHETQRETSLPMKNTGTSPYVVQAWVDAGDGCRCGGISAVVYRSAVLERI